MTTPVTAALDEIRRTLSFLSEQGVKGIDLPDETLSVLGRWGARPADGPRGDHRPGEGSEKIPHPPGGSFRQPPPRSMDGVGVVPDGGAKDALRSDLPASRSESLAQIREALGDCRRCGLSETRRHLVFGAGNPRARLVFVGEAPGYDEDLQGEPFVGAAGKLLTKIIEAMGLTRDDVYICNILKCRPPGNRNPQPDEMSMCTPFLNRQLASISPECICALGKFAAQRLLDTQAPISKLRGRFHEYNGIRLMPTYHPAYLLRNPEGKRDVWNDVQQIMAVLNLKVPGR